MGAKDMTLRERMQAERREQAVYTQAVAAGLAYDRVVDEAKRPVFPSPDALAGLAAFDEDLPAQTGDAAAVIDQLAKVGAPATVAQTGGRYFGFVNGGAVPVATAARLLADFWDQNAALAVVSPLAAKLEVVVEKWMRDLLHLPPQTAVGFVTGSSQGALCGLTAARWRLYNNVGWDVNRRGLCGAPRLRVVASEAIHLAVRRAVAFLGLGLDSVEWVPTDNEGRIIPAKIPLLDSHCILALQAGHVGSGAFDNFGEIFAREDVAQAWVHIDGAFGMWAAACERLAHRTAGAARAQSWSIDNHKTLNVCYDSGMVLCADKEALTSALPAAASYLPPASSEARDATQYSGDLSRRARIVELWATLKYLGRAGVDELVYGLHERARQLADEAAAEGFHILNEVAFNQVLLAGETEEQTQRILQLVQDSGECWMSETQRLPSGESRFAIRVSICSWATTEDDIRRTVAAFVQARAESGGKK